MTDPIPARVLSVGPLSPHLVRLRLEAPGFTPLGVPDEACVVSFPDGDAVEATATDPRAGHWYTVRRVDPDGSLTVDVVVHEGGAASAWAHRGRPGDVLQLWSQGSWFKRPPDATWQLVLVDTTGLPALGRAVEEAPPGVRTIAVVEVPDVADRQDLPGADVTWLTNPVLVHGDSRLEQIARAATLPDGPGYVYVAGEASATRGVRRYLRHELRLPAERYGVIGYWRRHAAAWAARLAGSGVDLEQLWGEAEAVGGGDEEAARDAYEERLDRVGLL